MMEQDLVMLELRTLCELIASKDAVSDEVVRVEVERFETLEMPPGLKAQCMAAIGTTLEQRNPDHLADSRRE